MALVPYARTKKYMAKTNSRKRLRSSVSLRSIVRNLEVLQHQIGSLNTALVQSTWYGMSPSYQIAQGSTDATRIGGEVFLEYLDLRLHLAAVTGNNEVTDFKVVVVKSPVVVVNANFGIASIAAGDYVYDTTAAVWAPGAIMDRKECTVLFEDIISVQPSIASTYAGTHLTKRVAIKSKMQFRTGLNSGRTYNLIVLVVAQNRGSGAVTIAEAQGSYDLAFRNAA